MEIRYQPQQPVRLNVLGVVPQTLKAKIVNLTGRRASLILEKNIVAGTAVRIDLEDSMLLGEATACVADVGGFVAHIEVFEAIPSLSDLARLVAAVMNEGRSEVPEKAISRAAGTR
jgi:hypothetical protein